MNQEQDFDWGDNLKPKSRDSRKERNGTTRGYTSQDLIDEAEVAVENAVESARSSNAWVVTFGDLMSLLLVFFVMLYAMSELKVQKFIEVAESLRRGFGLGAPPAYTGISDDSTTFDGHGYAQDPVEDMLDEIQQQLEGFAAEYELANTVEIVRDEIGITLRIQDMVLFDAGSAELKAESQWIAEKLAQIVHQIAIPVIVSGHTDSTPISNLRYPSNWELSGARASTLARLFIRKGLEPTGVHIEGFAEYRPTATNDTAVGRARNRRVELLYTRENVFREVVGRLGEEEARALWRDLQESVTPPIP